MTSQHVHSDAEILFTMNQLRAASLATGSQRAYHRAVSLWYQFCRQRHPHTHHDPNRQSGRVNLDSCVGRYIATLHRDDGGRRRQLAINTVYGLYYYFPILRHHMVNCEQMIRGWSRLHPSVSHPPLTWPIVTLIAVTMATNGYGDGALATLVAFDGLLRISQMAALLVSDVPYHLINAGVVILLTILVPIIEHNNGKLSYPTTIGCHQDWE